MSVWIATWTSMASATRSAARMAAGVDPQSSCTFRPAAPASICSISERSPDELPLPSMPMFTGTPSLARSIISMFQVPEVMVVPLVPSVGPNPPPNRVVTPLLNAAYACCGATRCTCESMPAAVRINCSPEIASVAGPVVRPGVTPSMVPELPAFPIPTIRPSLIPTSAFTTPSSASITTTFVITRSSAPSALHDVGS